MLLDEPRYHMPILTMPISHGEEVQLLCHIGSTYAHVLVHLPRIRDKHPLTRTSAVRQVVIEGGSEVTTLLVQGVVGTGLCLC
jgi:hypothetical protein